MFHNKTPISVSTSMRPAAGRILIIALGTLFLVAEVLRAESLTEAWTAAIANNHQLAASQHRVAAARNEYEATVAERIPDAWVRSSYTLQSDSPSFRMMDPIGGLDSFRFPYEQRDFVSVGAHVRVPVYTSGRIKNSILGAQMRLTAEEYDVAMARNELLLAIGEAYLTVLRAQRELTVADQNLATLLGHEAEVQSFLAQKRVARNEFLAAQVATATARQHRLNEINALEIARGKYNRFLGRPLETPVDVQELMLPTLPQTLQDLKQIAWQRRPNLLLARAAADAQMFNSRRTRATGLPQVSVVGSCEFQENRYRSPEALASASVIVDWNFFDRRRKYREAAELSQVESLNRTVEDLRSRIDLELLTAWNDRHAATERIRVAGQALDHADEDLRISRLRFARGMDVSSDVLDAQSRRTQVERDYYNSSYDRTLSQLRLRYAAGILGEG